MKKKFSSVLSLILLIVSIFSVSAYASEKKESENYDFIQQNTLYDWYTSTYMDANSYKKICGPAKENGFDLSSFPGHYRRITISWETNTRMKIYLKNIKSGATTSVKYGTSYISFDNLYNGIYVVLGEATSCYYGNITFHVTTSNYGR